MEWWSGGVVESWNSGMAEDGIPHSIIPLLHHSISPIPR